MKKVLFIVLIFSLLESFFGCGLGRVFQGATNVGCILPAEDEEERGENHGEIPP